MMTLPRVKGSLSGCGMQARKSMHANLAFFHRNRIPRVYTTRDCVKPEPEKVQGILALTLPENVKQLCRFLGMVQYLISLKSTQN